MPCAADAGAVHGSARLPALPAAARRLRLPLHQRSQLRMAERWGFTIDAADARSRAEALRDELPEDADRQALLAAVLASRGDDARALTAARAAVALAPGSARAHTTLAAILARTPAQDEALTHARRAAELDPRDPAILYNRGLLLVSAHDRSAAADFRAAEELLGLPPLPRWRRWFQRS